MIRYDKPEFANKTYYQIIEEKEREKYKSINFNNDIYLKNKIKDEYRF